MFQLISYSPLLTWHISLVLQPSTLVLQNFFSHALKTFPNNTRGAFPISDSSIRMIRQKNMIYLKLSFFKKEVRGTKRVYLGYHSLHRSFQTLTSSALTKSTKLNPLQSSSRLRVPHWIFCYSDCTKTHELIKATPCTSKLWQNKQGIVKLLVVNPQLRLNRAFFQYSNISLITI